MPRQRQSKVESILEFFQSGDAGEAKVVFELARSILRQRFPSKPTKVAVKHKTRKAAPEAVAESQAGEAA
jgi:hypothetical protein